MRSLDRIAHWDLQLCVKLNRVCYRLSWRVLFRCVSMLGDGIAWYGLMAVLLLRYRNEAVVPVLHMMVVGMICTAGYKLLKAHTSRPRPYQVHRSIQHYIAPLDQFSFPSGHTLHAVAFSLIAVAYYPALSAALTVFSLLVAASRVVLGLHYPSDVVAGAAIGGGIALASIKYLALVA
jgi:undecaprenyl-diphosphatase